MTSRPVPRKPSTGPAGRFPEFPPRDDMQNPIHLHDQIPEYWRFDPSGGHYHGTPLAGDRLVGGAYRPIPIESSDDSHFWGRNEALGLDLCWEEGRLRWHDPVARLYLLTFDETDDARLAAEEERAEERRARLDTEAERDEERRARLAAEERARDLEAEIRRLQD